MLHLFLHSAVSCFNDKCIAAKLPLLSKLLQQNWLQIPLIPLFITPTNYARKNRKIFSFHFVSRLWLSSSQNYILNVKGCVFLYQNTRLHDKYLNQIYTILSNFLISRFMCYLPIPADVILAPPIPGLYP